MKVLVAGGAGFIGSEVCRQLVADEHDVLVLDNYFTAREGSVPQAVRVARVDLADPDDAALREAVVGFAPDYAIHLAAISYIPYCLEHPGDTFQTNVGSAERLCRVLAETACRRLVMSSTADVYQVNDDTHHEDDDLGPRNIYGLSKMLAEQILEYTSAVSDLATTCLRFANVYGPGETNPHVVVDAIEFIRNRETAEIRMGYLGAERDFVHVSDVARAIRTAAFTDTGRFSVFNIGTGYNTPIRGLVALLQELLGDDRTVVEDVRRLRKFDRDTLRVDTRRIGDVLGWKAEISLRDGLSRLIAG
jgi:UDP-glucose 4-epimerase